MIFAPSGHPFHLFYSINTGYHIQVYIDQIPVVRLWSPSYQSSQKTWNLVLKCVISLNVTKSSGESLTAGKSGVSAQNSFPDYILKYAPMY